MGDRPKISYLNTLYLVLSIVGIIWFSKSLAINTHDFLNRELLEASLASTKHELKKVTVELDYLKADLGRMGAEGNDDLRNKAEQRMSELKQKEVRLRTKYETEQIKAKTIPTDWKDFFGIQFKDLVGWLLSLISIYIAIVSLRKNSKKKRDIKKSMSKVQVKL